MTGPAGSSAPMSWQVCYGLDFGFCFNYPKEYWLGYSDTLGRYGCNAVMLWVAGMMPTPGFEETLAWRCDYVPQVVEHLRQQAFQDISDRDLSLQVQQTHLSQPL